MHLCFLFPFPLFLFHLGCHKSITSPISPFRYTLAGNRCLLVTENTNTLSAQPCHILSESKTISAGLRGPCIQHHTIAITAHIRTTRGSRELDTGGPGNLDLTYNEPRTDHNTPIRHGPEHTALHWCRLLKRGREGSHLYTQYNNVHGEGGGKVGAWREA